MSTTAPKADQLADTPYRRSWVDAVVGLVDRLPGPAWVPYTLVTLVFVAAGTGFLWLDGALPVGTISPPRIAIDILAIYGLAAIHYAKRVARTSLEAFRPALGELESQLDGLRFRLTNLPRRLGIISIVVAVVFTALSLATALEAWNITATTSPGVVAFIVVEALMLMIFFVTFGFFAYHHYFTVVRIHRTATNVKLLETAARSGFSPLTLSTSISVALPIYFSSLTYLVAGEFLVGVGPVDVVLMVAVLATAALVFVVPLYGMHRRLVHQKALAVDSVGRSFEAATAELHRRVAAKDFEGLGGLNTALSSLTVERDVLRRATTWPWEADTLRGFLSSIVLPVGIWLATTLLGRLLT